MKQITITVYQFDELSEDVQELVLQKLQSEYSNLPDFVEVAEQVAKSEESWFMEDGTQI